MRTVRIRTALLAALAVALAATPAWAQKMRKADVSQPPDVYRMEIFNGGFRTVHYVTPSYLSPSESSSLREMERTENELALSDQLFALRAQYAVNEQALEAKRRTMQELLYGYNREESSSYVAGSSGPVGAAWGGGWGGWGYGGGWANNVVASSGTTTHTLAVGVGMNEGVVKNELAKYLATPAMSEQAALVYRNYRSALAGLERHPRLLAGLGLEGVEGTKAGFSGTDDVIYLKDGSTISGRVVKEDNDWLTVETRSGKAKRTERVRTSEVTRVSRTPDAEKASDK